MEDILLASEAYEDAIDEAQAFGLLSSEELLKIAEKHGLFSTQERAEYEELESHPMFRYSPFGEFPNDALKNRFLERTLSEIILGFRVIRVDDIFYSHDIKPNQIEYMRFTELNAKKSYVIKHSIEHYAEQKRADIFTYFCCYNPDTDKRVWSSFEAFKKEQNLNVTKLVQLRCLEFLGGFNSTILRFLARHGMWRSKWVSATKTGSPIFKGTITEWSINQTLLSYWSNFYDSIYSASEPPEDFIIAKDELLDKWLENKNSEMKRKQSETESGDTFKAHFTTHQVMPIKKR